MARRTAAAVLALVVVACTPPGAPRARAASPSPATGIQAFISKAEHFIEARRGLKFLKPVSVEQLGDKAFQARLNQHDPKDVHDEEVSAKELHALHLVDPGVDVQKAETELEDAGVVGFYDPATKALVVRGNDAGPAAQHVLVHELTHALQDQHFNLGADTSTDDEGTAFRALVEGDAVRIEQAYIESLSPADRQQAQRGGEPPPADVPSVLVELLSFPYSAGLRFVQAVDRSGGQAAVDRAFEHHPQTTSEVIHPDRYLAAFQATPVADPPADGTVFDRGVLGELGLALVLERLPQGTLATTDGRDLIGGWRGDRYVAWDAASGACMRVTFALDTPAHDARLAAALGRAPNVTVTATADRVTLTSCG